MIKRSKTKMKILTIIRGVSGSGKSTYAEHLKLLDSENTIICTADDYHINPDTGEYEFDVDNIHAAHNWCKNKFNYAVKNNVKHVIVNNTSTKRSEFDYYKNYAEERGYKVFVVVMENWHGGENIHKVPPEVLDRQETNIQNSLKLR